jgi:ATP-dependent DNA helicase DinG
MLDQYLLLYIRKYVGSDKSVRIDFAYFLLSNELTCMTQYEDSNISEDEFLLHILPLLEKHIVVLYDADYQLEILNEVMINSGYNDMQVLYIDLLELIEIFLPTTNISDFTEDLDHGQSNNKLSVSELLSRCAKIFAQVHSTIIELPLLIIQRIADLYRNNKKSVMYSFLISIEQKILLKPNLMNLPHDLQTYHQIVLKKISIEALDVVHEHPEILLDFFKNRSNDDSLFKEYEIRPQQQQMLEIVNQALTEQKHLLIEAGTGTGKTLAYLLPLLSYCLAHDEKVIVATNTIVLQRQILDRDIPILKKIYDVPFNVMIFKGRSHYLCLRKFNLLINNAIDFNENIQLMSKILVWLSLTETGDGEEINCQQHTSWQAISSDTESCLNKKCNWFNQCFYYLARNKAHNANIIITNHSMVFSDIKADHQILPKYNYIVFDEAHHIENEATKHLGIEIHYYNFIRLLQYIYKNDRSGLISNAKKYLLQLGNQDIETHDYDKLLQELLAIADLLIEFKITFDDFITTTQAWIKTVLHDKGYGTQTLRFNENIRSQFPYGYLVDNLKSQITSINKLIDKLELTANNEDVDSRLVEYLEDIISQNKYIKHFQQNLSFFFDVEDKNFVYWIETDFNLKYLNMSLYAAPIDVGSLLYEKLFSKKASCILTSATLAIRGSFKYALRRLGLADNYADSVLTLALDSPFDYQQQCLVCIPTDIPAVNNAKQFLDSIGDLIIDLIIERQGSTLILFTSNDLLYKMYELLKDNINLKNSSIKVLGQNIDSSSKSKLIEQFQLAKKAVLLGTNSFWEGIDIPGTALTCVCIIKLPFWPPNLPVVAARSELIDMNNGNSFMEYSIPEAIIRFKQGFGRLIRTKSDKGVVIIFDRRIIDKSYGRYFLSALPNPNIKQVKASDLIKESNEWIK